MLISRMIAFNLGKLVS